jgi:hypothetical protein
VIPLEFNTDQEEVITFALSPNEKYLATANKNYIIRIYQLPSFQYLSGLSKEATASEIE